MNVAVKWRTRQNAVKGKEGRRWKEAGRREKEVGTKRMRESSPVAVQRMV
jgi:hypothetical protein